MYPRGFSHSVSSATIGGTLGKVWHGMSAKPKDSACDLLVFSDGTKSLGSRDKLCRVQCWRRF